MAPNNSSLAAGAVVRLKSGDVAMTVEHVKESTATCAWFSTDHVLQRAVFPFAALDVDSGQSNG